MKNIGEGTPTSDYSADRRGNINIPSLRELFTEVENRDRSAAENVDNEDDGNDNDTVVGIDILIFAKMLEIDALLLLGNSTLFLYHQKWTILP